MANSTIVILDISTSSTGWAVFDKKTKSLLEYGKIVPKVPGLHKLKYPAAVYRRIKSMSEQVKDLIALKDPTMIVIEEVNRGISRIGQKGLDACHFFVLDYLCLLSEEWLTRVVYVDSNGKKGWRPALGMRLSDADKEANKKIRAAKRKGDKNAKPIDWKILAERYVYETFKLKFDVHNVPGDNDICDAICLGDAYLKKLIK